MTFIRKVTVLLLSRSLNEVKHVFKVSIPSAS